MYEVPYPIKNAEAGGRRQTTSIAMTGSIKYSTFDNFIKKNINFLERAFDKTNYFGNYVWMFVIILGTGLMLGAPISIVERMRGGTMENGNLAEFPASQNIDFLLMLIPFAVILFACIWAVK